ncbi:MAG: transposase, partial [Algiphilus sp.]
SNKIARLHRKIANIRKDTLHKLTSYLAQNHSRIGIENLNVSGMMANQKLAKAIADMGFGEFKRQA